MTVNDERVALLATLAATLRAGHEASGRAALDADHYVSVAAKLIAAAEAHVAKRGA